jgi:hypothetical protein
MLGIGLASLIALIYLFWNLKKNNPDKKLGELLSRETIKNNEFILEAILMVLFLSEAMTAATVISGDQNQGFAFGRFLMHMSISFVGAVCAITLVRDIASMFEKKSHFGFYINNFLIAIILASIAFYVPFFNVQAIASNLNSSYEFQEWIYKWTHSDAAYNTYLIKHRFPEIRDVFAEFETVLKVSIGQGVLHIAVTILLGLRATSTAGRLKALMDKEEEGDKKKEEKKEEKNEDKSDEKKKDPEKGLADLVEFLLRRIGYSDTTKIANIITQVNGALEKLSQTDRAVIGTNLGNLRIAAMKVDSTKDPTEKGKAKASHKKDIVKIFTNKPTESKPEDKGLGINVKNSGN